jgi:hypothetical protein
MNVALGVRRVARPTTILETSRKRALLSRWGSVAKGER